MLTTGVTLCTQYTGTGHRAQGTATSTRTHNQTEQKGADQHQNVPSPQPHPTSAAVLRAAYAKHTMQTEEKEQKNSDCMVTLDAFRRARSESPSPAAAARAGKAPSWTIVVAALGLRASTCRQTKLTLPGAHPPLQTRQAHLTLRKPTLQASQLT